MPTTFQALVVTLIAVFPGALYVWGLERQTGSWGLRNSDRVIRFIGSSVFINLLLAPLTVSVWLRYGDPQTIIAWKDSDSRLWGAAFLYAIVPMLLGELVGYKTKTSPSSLIARIFSGPNPAPTGWDLLFSRDPRGWIRIKLEDGTWLAGLFVKDPETGRESYASGYDEVPGDIYLLAPIELDPVTHEFPSVDPSKLDFNRTLLVRRDSIQFIEFRHF